MMMVRRWRMEPAVAALAIPAYDSGISAVILAYVAANVLRLITASDAIGMINGDGSTAVIDTLRLEAMALIVTRWVFFLIGQLVSHRETILVMKSTVELLDSLLLVELLLIVPSKLLQLAVTHLSTFISPYVLVVVHALNLAMLLFAWPGLWLRLFCSLVRTL